jgi:hypothetical protein
MLLRDCSGPFCDVLRRINSPKKPIFDMALPSFDLGRLGVLLRCGAGWPRLQALQGVGWGGGGVLQPGSKRSPARIVVPVRAVATRCVPRSSHVCSPHSRGNGTSAAGGFFQQAFKQVGQKKGGEGAF